MQHPTFLPRADGEIPPYLQEWCNQESIGMLLIRELSSVEAAATTMNTIQEYAEGSVWVCRLLVLHGLGSTVCPTYPARRSHRITSRWPQPAMRNW